MTSIMKIACICFGGIYLLITSTTFAATTSDSIEWVNVGDPGNPANDSGIDKADGFGSVDQTFRISQFEITNQQYADFLNAKAASDPYGLFDPQMSEGSRAGIERKGREGAYHYRVKKGREQWAVISVDYLDTLRFCNWLHNGGGDGDTETGAYTIIGGADAEVAPKRNSDARVFLPSENEWFKAAYYQPEEKNGPIDGYWLYATAHSSQPTEAIVAPDGSVSNPGANVINFEDPNTSFDPKRPGQGNGPDRVSIVGATGSRSYYGTADQSGNVWEWVDSEGRNPRYKRLRGASFFQQSPDNTQVVGSAIGKTNSSFGFRVASPMNAKQN